MHTKFIELLNTLLGRKDYNPNPEATNLCTSDLIKKEELFPQLLEKITEFNSLYKSFVDLFDESGYVKDNGSYYLQYGCEYLAKLNNLWHYSPKVLERSFGIYAYQMLLYSIKILKNLFEKSDLSFLDIDKENFNRFVTLIRVFELRLNENLRDSVTWQTCRFEIAMQWLLVFEVVEQLKNDHIMSQAVVADSSTDRVSKKYEVMSFEISEEAIYQRFAASLMDSHPSSRNNEIYKVLINYIADMYLLSCSIPTE